MDHNNKSLIRNSALARNRVFVGNLPDKCTKDELECLFARFGKILASIVQKNYGFVQFENESIANAAASALSASFFKGKKIIVRNAGKSKKVKIPNSDKSKTQSTNEIDRSDCNDCELVVCNRDNTLYAEYIEHQLKMLGMKVDILFPNEDVPVGKVLANISSRGCLYAIVINDQNEQHRSITVNFLYGLAAEHRNMPVEDALKLIATDFRNNMQEIQKVSNSTQAVTPSNSESTASLQHNTQEKINHPEVIQMLLQLLIDNKSLTVLQYDKIINYLSEKRDLQVKIELGDTQDMAPISNLIGKEQTAIIPDPEIELRKKIVAILKKPPIIENKINLVYSTVKSLHKDLHTIELLKDSKIQCALDTLMTTSLVSELAKYFEA